MTTTLSITFRFCESNLIGRHLSGADRSPLLYIGTNVAVLHCFCPCLNLLHTAQSSEIMSAYRVGTSWNVSRNKPSCPAAFPGFALSIATSIRLWKSSFTVDSIMLKWNRSLCSVSTYVVNAAGCISSWQSVLSGSLQSLNARFATDSLIHFMR